MNSNFKKQLEQFLGNALGNNFLPKELQNAKALQWNSNDPSAAGNQFKEHLMDQANDPNSSMNQRIIHGFLDFFVKAAFGPDKNIHS